MRGYYPFDTGRPRKKQPPRKTILRSLAQLLWTGQPTLIAFVKNPPSTLTVRPGEVEQRKWEVLVVRLETKYSEMPARGYPRYVE